LTQTGAVVNSNDNLRLSVSFCACGDGRVGLCSTASVRFIGARGAPDAEKAVCAHMSDKQDFTYAGFWVRVWAAVLDLVLFFLLTVPVLYAIHGREYFRSEIVARGTLDFLNMFVLPNALILLCWLLGSATPGKRAVGAKIADARTGERPRAYQFLLRLAGLYLAALPLGLGLLWVALDRRKQGWHDKLAGTVVLRAPR
jgi:uncharacterized RDD family membrane protein YckC